MTLTLTLAHPVHGRIVPPVVSGTLSVAVDRYPRWGLDVQMRPDRTRPEVFDSPYGTVAVVQRPDGTRMFTGPVTSAGQNRPGGDWTLQAYDPTSYLAAARFSERPGQTLPGTYDLAGWIRAVAAALGVASKITVADGGGGTVDGDGIDLAGKDGWRAVEDQLIAAALDAQVDGDGTIRVVPLPALRPAADRTLRVGRSGTVTGWDLRLASLHNRVVVSHRARKDGEQEERWVDGVWTDDGPLTGVGAVGPRTYTKTVDVGADWWDNPAGHQAQADQNAAAAAATLRGDARTADVEAVPDYQLRAGDTVEAVLGDRIADRFLAVSVQWQLAPGPMRVALRNPEPDTTAARIMDL